MTEGPNSIGAIIVEIHTTPKPVFRHQNLDLESEKNPSAENVVSMEGLKKIGTTWQKCSMSVDLIIAVFKDNTSIP